LKARSIFVAGFFFIYLPIVLFPCPNLFASEHVFHSLEEWVSVQDMGKSSEMIVHLAGIWANHEK